MQMNNKLVWTNRFQYLFHIRNTDWKQGDAAGNNWLRFSNLNCRGKRTGRGSRGQNEWYKRLVKKRVLIIHDYRRS